MATKKVIAPKTKATAPKADKGIAPMGKPSAMKMIAAPVRKGSARGK